MGSRTRLVSSSSRASDDATADSVCTVLLIETRAYHEALAEALENRGVACATASGLEGIEEVISSGRPVVLLIDMARPESLVLLRSLARHHGCEVVSLVDTESEDVVIPCIEAGAIGYVTREAPLDHVADTIRTASRGEAPFSPVLVGSLVRRVAELAHQRRPERAHQLTEREIEIAGLIDAGMSNKEIADRLCIEVTTVKNHVHRILEKLHVHRRGEAAAKLRAQQGGPALAEHFDLPQRLDLTPKSE